MLGLTPLENDIITILQRYSESTDVGDISHQLELLKDAVVDRYALFELLVVMRRKKVIRLKGATVTLIQPVPPFDIILPDTALPVVMKKATNKCKIGSVSEELKIHQLPSNIRFSEKTGEFFGDITRIESDIITVLQAYNGSTTVAQVIKGLYKLNVRIYGKEVLFELLDAMNVKGIVWFSGTKVVLVEGLPLCCEDDYKRLRRRKRHTSRPRHVDMLIEQ